MNTYANTSAPSFPVPLTPEANWRPMLVYEHRRLLDNTLEQQLAKAANELKEQFRSTLRPVRGPLARYSVAVFSELDRLLDPEEWDDESQFIDKSSFGAFLAFLLFAQPKDSPCLGIDQRGHIMAAWIQEPKRVFATFIDIHSSKASIARPSRRGSLEISTWSGATVDLLDYLRREEVLDCLGSSNDQRAA